MVEASHGNVVVRFFLVNLRKLRCERTAIRITPISCDAAHFLRMEAVAAHVFDAKPGVRFARIDVVRLSSI